MSRAVPASFLDPMLCLATAKLPESTDWQCEVQLDGYRAVGIKTGSEVQLRSRNNNDFAGRYPAIAKALPALPKETVVDGEIVAFDEAGRPSFNKLQNYGSSHGPIFYYGFDLLMLSGRDVRPEPLHVRREMLETKVLTKLDEPIRYSPALEGRLDDLIVSLRKQKCSAQIVFNLTCARRPLKLF